MNLPNAVPNKEMHNILFPDLLFQTGMYRLPFLPAQIFSGSLQRSDAHAEDRSFYHWFESDSNPTECQADHVPTRYCPSLHHNMEAVLPSHYADFYASIISGGD